MEWISIKDQLPPQGVEIKIKAHYDDHIEEAICVFEITDVNEFHELWRWKLSQQESNKYGTLRPTHWMPLPQPPKD